MVNFPFLYSKSAMAAGTPTAQPTVNIIYSDLDFAVQRGLHAYTQATMRSLPVPDDRGKFDQLAEMLKTKIEQLTSEPGWCCIVGVGFAACFSFEGSSVHHFSLGEVAVLLFRSKPTPPKTAR